MRSRWLAALFLLILATGSVVHAQCTGQDAVQPLPNSMCEPFIKYVADGRNRGEPEVIYWITGHRYVSYFDGAHQSFGNWTISWQRTHDAQGVPVSGPDNPTNFISITSPNFAFGCQGAPPAANGCARHKWWGGGWPGQIIEYPHGYNWEEALISKGADPGRYRLRIHSSNLTGMYEISREFNTSPLYPVVEWVFTDQHGEPVEGLNVVVTAPTSRLIGPSNSGGAITELLPPGSYTFHVQSTDPDVLGLPDQTIEVFDLNTGGAPMQTHRYSVLRNGTPEEEDKGHLQVTVKKKSDGSPLPGVTANVAGTDKTTDSEGKVVFKNLEPGDTTIRVSLSGYVPGVLRVRIDRGTTRQYTIRMSTTAEGDEPEIESDSSTEDGGFWHNLFVPKEATMNRFGAFLDRVKAWGPFGVITAFSNAFDAAARTGPGSLYWEFNVQLNGVGSPGVSGGIDLRPLLPEGQDYGAPHPGRGSLFGNMIVFVRRLLGAAVWAIFIFGLMRKLWPRLIL